MSWGNKGSSFRKAAQPPGSLRPRQRPLRSQPGLRRITVEALVRLDPMSPAISEEDPSLAHTKALLPGQRTAGLSFSCYSLRAMSRPCQVRWAQHQHGDRDHGSNHNLTRSWAMPLERQFWNVARPTPNLFSFQPLNPQPFLGREWGVHLKQRFKVCSPRSHLKHGL